jgi:thiamine-phosphate pyrophosphorylase
VIAPLPRLMAVTDDRIVGRGDIVERAAAMAEASGPALAVQLRARSLSGAALLALARRLGAALAPRGSWLVVNDRADVARAAGARAVQLGRGSLAVRDARRVAPDLAAGRSVHGAAEIAAARAEGADFLVAGPVHATASHPGAPGAGAALLREAAATGLPVVAIGGLTPEGVEEAVAAGAWGVAAVRALWDAQDPGAAARAFVAALPAASSLAVVVNGESRSVAEGTTLRGLLAQLGLDSRAVVAELNRRIVRRDALDATRLAAGDVVELVHFVGGG